MNFAAIFSVFSRRNSLAVEHDIHLTKEFRNRVFLLWSRIFRQETSGVYISDPTLWEQVYDKLLYLQGRQRLSVRHAQSRDVDLRNFLSECSDEHFLDFIELSFQTTSLWQEIDLRDGTPIDVTAIIDDVNRFFEVDDLPYYLTKFTIGDGQIEAYPQIIRRDNTALHETVIEPTLSLLSHPSFVSANEEFLDALKDYRVGDYRDCVVKAGSALESVMKIICAKRKWPYTHTDTMSTLVRNILRHSNLDSYFEQPIMVIATIRNRLGKAHGAGTQTKSVPRHVANYVINATGSTILLLMQEADP